MKKQIAQLQKKQRPIRVLQFGGGVFLRGFFDWMLQKANDAGVYDGNAVILRSRTGGTDPLQKQSFNYTHVARDAAHSDVTAIECIADSVDVPGCYETYLELAKLPSLEVIVSNTTEAGIVYENCTRPEGKCPSSYPAKLTDLLYHRFLAGGDGVLILPCELIEKNGETLRAIVLRHAEDWGLGEAFVAWLDGACSFRNTLVDRIVSGAPASDDVLDLPYEDEMVNTSEYFHLFVIEGEPDPRLPFAQAGLQVKWVASVEDYRTIKVRILNGAHTSMIPFAMLCGLETVGDCLRDTRTRDHLSACLNEILASMDGDPDEARAYADSVLERFSNPYIRHLCRAISLNSISKFKVRVLPSILAYREKTGELPKQLIFAFGMLLRFYRGGTPTDDESVIAKCRALSTAELLADESLWGVSLADLATEVDYYANTPF